MKELTSRMKELCQLCRCGVEVTVKIPHAVFTDRKDNGGNPPFLETQRAFERLKKDNRLFIDEKTLKEKINDENFCYKIITIKTRI